MKQLKALRWLETISSHPVEIFCNMLGAVGSSLKLVKFEPTTKRMQHVAPSNVSICCVGVLRSFGQGFSKLKKHYSKKKTI